MKTRVPISALRLAKNDSATALSKHDPVRPIDGRMSSLVSAARKSVEVYWLPRSEWKIAFERDQAPRGEPVHGVAHEFGAHVVAMAWPTTSRLNRSIVVARYSQPSAVGR